MDYVKRVNETLHIGSDWIRAYTITGDINFTNARGVCKLRTHTDDLIAEAQCSMEDNRLFVEIKGTESLTFEKKLRKVKYDVFLITDEQVYKLVMGNMTIIHDVSMH